MTDCIDLAATYGDRYRISSEPQAALWPPADRLWLARIACLHGHVGVQGGRRLVAFTDRARIGAQLRALPGIERAQGDAEVRAVFDVDHLSAVLALLRPYRRRQVSAAERARLAAMGAAHRFTAGDGLQGAFPAPESTQTGSADPQGRAG
ncbi:MAG: hypothetical protein ACRERC_12310 [Candidatus Binatia bacterium]